MCHNLKNPYNSTISLYVYIYFMLITMTTYVTYNDVCVCVIKQLCSTAYNNWLT